MESSFSFLRSPAASQPEPEPESEPEPLPIDDIQLFAAAEAKQVKKKKRAPRIGFARNDEADEEVVDGDDDGGGPPRSSARNDEGERVVEGNTDPVPTPIATTRSEIQRPVAEPRIEIESHAPSDGANIDIYADADVPPPANAPLSEATSTPPDRTTTVDVYSDADGVTTAAPDMPIPDDGGGGDDDDDDDAHVHEKLRGLETLIAERAVAARTCVAARRQITDLERLIDETSAAVAKMEVDQQRLAAEEEYDKAAALNEAIDVMQKEIVQHQGAIAALTSTPANGACRSSSEQQCAVLEARQLSALEEVRAWMATTAESTDDDDQGAVHQQARAQAQQELAAEERRLRSEADRIALERSHVQEEADALQEHRLATESAITAQVSDATELKQRLQQSLAAVDADIAELERQLALKRDEAKGLAADLVAAEDRIAEVRRKFQRQLQHIEDREAQVRLIQDACDADNRALEDKWAALKAHADAVEAAQRSRASRRRRLVAGADAVAVVLAALSGGVTAWGGDVAEGGDGDGAEEGEGEATSTSLSEVATTLAAATARHREKVALAAKLAVDLAGAQEAAAALERDKKTHAAAKRFREAATAAKDEKACLERKEELEAAMARALDDAAALALEVDDLAQKHGNVKQQREAARRRADTRRRTVIAARMQDMQLAKQRVHDMVCGTEEGPAASLLSVLLAALDAEIDVLEVFCGALSGSSVDVAEADAEPARQRLEAHIQDLVEQQAAAAAKEDFDAAAALEDSIQQAREELNVHA